MVKPTAEELAFLLETLRKLEAEATPGPWEAVSVMPAGERYGEDGRVVASWSESPWRVIGGPPQAIQDEMLSRRAFTHAPDTALIAALRNAAPALLTEIERLGGYVAQLEAALRDNVCSEGAVAEGRCMNCGTRGCGWARELLEAKS